MGLASWYKRLRHSYGYGVHSPFAYALVRRAVSPGRYCWYGYADIDAALYDNPSRGVRRQARILLRLAASLSPRSVFLPMRSHSAYHAALEAADSRMHIERRPAKAAGCEMICSNGEFIPYPVLAECLSRPGGVVALRDVSPDWPERLFEGMEEGLMLRGRRNALLVAREGMRKVAYTVNI